jgi:hypothetical protein
MGAISSAAEQPFVRDFVHGLRLGDFVVRWSTQLNILSQFIEQANGQMIPSPASEKDLKV